MTRAYYRRIDLAMLDAKIARSVCSLALMLALLGSSLMPRAILCIAPGGHRAIEIVGAAGACPAPAERVQSKEHAGDPGCPAGCVDAPIVTSFVASMGSQHGRVLLSPAVMRPAPALLLDLPRRAAMFASQQLGGDPSVRTVIIRC